MTDTSDFYCENILSGKLKVEVLKETENVLAYFHTRPISTFHAVVIPKEHTLDLTTVGNLEIIKEIFTVIKEIIQKFKLNKKNYRVITNGGSFQDSKHLHFHIISGGSLIK